MPCPLTNTNYNYCLLYYAEEFTKTPERQDTVTSFHTTGSSKDVMGSTSTLQVITLKRLLSYIDY